MKVLTTVYFDDDVFKKLKEYAYQLQISKSEFIRQAVSEFISKKIK